MAILNSGNITYTANNDNPIVIKVSGGNFSAPYYTFKDENDNSIDIYNGGFKFMRGKTYKFQANGISSSHPFKIVQFDDQGNITDTIMNGNTAELTVTMTGDNYYYQCVAHPGMKSNNLQFLYGTVEGVDYNFYYGDIDVTVNGDFNEVSVYCLCHGYMGGEGLLVYNNA